MEYGIEVGKAPTKKKTNLRRETGAPAWPASLEGGI